MKKASQIMFYLTIVEIVIALIILIHDMTDANLGLGVFVIGLIDTVIIVYYIILNRIVNFLNKKEINTVKLIALFIANILPILFYLHLLDYI